MPASIYKLPSSAQFATLTPEIADALKAHFRSAKEHRAQICLIAHAIRDAHIHTPKDKTREVYSTAFDDWYNANKLDSVFGQKANFTKHAQVGERVFHFIANKLDAPAEKRAEFLDRLPISISALYEISTLYNAHDIKSGVKIAGHRSGWDELRLALTGAPSRRDISDPIAKASSNSKPLIHPGVTAAEIIAWKTSWRFPPQKKTRATKTTVPFLVVYVNGEVYDFDKKTGVKIGRVDLSDVEKKLQAIRAVFTDDELASQVFRIDDDLKWIIEGYRIREWSSSNSRAFVDRPQRTVLERLPTGPDGIPRKAITPKKATAKNNKAPKTAAFLTQSKATSPIPGGKKRSKAQATDLPTDDTSVKNGRQK